MRDTLTHRGPDDAGVFIDGGVGLGHRRLSIVDIGGGHQPMSNQACGGGEDGTIRIVFNGEIYNHQQLRPGLEQRGHIYRSSSDTETIIHLYEEYGPRGVQKLRGMFAQAIWDAAQRQLVLARDRVGIKPLYYTLSGDGTLHFASEIKALIEARAVAPELNYDSLADYAANRFTSGEDTLFRGVKRLLPGHTLVWREGQVKIERYWNLSFAKPDERLSDDQYVERFDQLFRECVESHLMSDVPLGMFLSGGIDSSAIAAVMSQMVSEPIKTFSVAFAEHGFSELDYARSVARAFKTDHHEIVVSPEQFFDALPTMIYQEDEPLAHGSSVPLYFVSKLAQDHVKVVLTGEGSDELLAGYPKYRTTMYNLKLGRAYHNAAPAGVQRAVERAIGSLGVGSRLRQKLIRTFLCIPPTLERIYFDNFGVYPVAMQQRLFSTETRARMGDDDPYRAEMNYIGKSDAESLLDQLLDADIKTYLHELLMKQDQMSMAASIESRVPFLDHHMIEFAAALPVRMKLRGLTTKYVLRRAMKNVLPPEILTRKKMGFPTPLNTWFRGQFRHVIDEYVLSPRARARGIFDHRYVSELAARHQAGENHGERLWMLVNMEIWHRRFIDGENTGNQTRQMPEAVRSVSAAD
jgi:asparagine synthase (glutamine-hydrolysing)